MPNASKLSTFFVIIMASGRSSGNFCFNNTCHMPVSVYAGWNLAPRRFAECITMNEIFPDIFVIKERGAFGAFKPEINVYVLAGSDGLIFDAGYGNRGAVRHLVREVHAIEERSDMKAGLSPCGGFSAQPRPSDHFSGLRSIREELGSGCC